MKHEWRVYGPPGTGKTYKIVHEILPRCIEKYGSAGVIVVSFTKTAASEIISRLGGQVQTFHSASDIDLSMDKVIGTKTLAGTIHSLCYHSLNSPKIATGKECMEEFCKEYKYAKSLMSGGRMEHIHYLKNKLVKYEDVKPGQLKILWRIWEDFKKKFGYLDFTDLILKNFERLTAPNDPLSIIIDEAQDMTPLQLRLFRHWNNYLKELWIVADDDQLIYNFLGSEARELIRTDLPDTEIHTEVLQKSRRLPIEIHEYAKSYIERLDKRAPKDFTHNGLHGEIKGTGVPIDSPKLINIIVKEAENRTVMVLASCEYMLNDLLGYMKNAGIPFSNKYRPDNLNWNPLNEKNMKIVNSLINSYNRNDVYNWIVYIKKEFLKDDNKIPKPSTVEGEAFYRPFIKDLLIDWVFDEFEDTEPEGRLKWFMNKISEKDQKKFEYIMKVRCGKYSHLIEVVAGTIHSVKGREAQCVILGADKSLAAIKSTKYDKSSIVRQFFVGMTRASEVLYLCVPKNKNKGINFYIPKT